MNQPLDLAKQFRLKRLADESAICHVVHPRVQRGLDLMQDVHDCAFDGSERTGVMLFGESRSGKTRLMKIYRDQQAVAGDSKGSIVFLSLSGATTVDSVVTDLLTAMGDPMPEVGKSHNKTNRLVRLLSEQQVSMLQIDEAQHLIDHRSDKVVHDIADWFKALMNDRNEAQPRLKLSFVLSGTPGLVRLLKLNSQLRNRFFAPLELQLFSTATDLDLKDLRILLISLERQIGVANNAHLGTSEMAIRFRHASGGCIGVILDLIRQAGKFALNAGRETITIADLADSYDIQIGVTDDVGNSFRAALPTVTQAALQHPEFSSDRKTVNRRSKARRREPTVGDVLRLRD
jgi:hypothetical protein